MTDESRTPDRSNPEHRPPTTPVAMADALNAALDGGAPSDPEVASLLDAAEVVRATPLEPGEFAPAVSFDALWMGIVQEVRPRAVPVSSQAAGFLATYPPSGLRRPYVGFRSRGRDGLAVWRTAGSWVSMALIAAMLIAMGSMVWSLRPGADGDHSLLASATSLAMGTALASPSPVATDGGPDAWLRWPEPADCDVAPMSQDEYARIMGTQPDISGRSYGVAGAPSEADAFAAADAARRQYACTLFSDRERQRMLSSPALTFFQSYSSARSLTDQEIQEAALEHGMLVSATAPAKQPSAYAVILASAPSEQVLATRNEGARTAVISMTYLPENALLLADGRVAIPGTALYWKDDFWEPQQWQIDDSDSFATFLTILTKESGTWTVDESLSFCPYAGCFPIWEQLATQWQVPLPTLDVPVPWTIPAGSGTATPIATPVE